MFGFIRRRRRARVVARPFPAAWEAVLRGEAPYFARLPEVHQATLRRHIQIFLSEKRFEGCNGLVVDDGMRVLVAAYACLLILCRETEYFPGLHAVLLYPDVFRVQREDPDELGFVDEVDDVQEGESWDLGTVILSWRDALGDIGRLDGRNVVLHEFAHQLWDNGEAVLPARVDTAAWLESMERHYDSHCRAVDRGLRTYLDPYGAEDPAEFFSCTTEQFFEQPRLFRLRLPALYDLLRQFYNQDPVAYFAKPDGDPAK